MNILSVARVLRSSLSRIVAGLLAPRDCVYCGCFGVKWKWGWRLRGLPTIRRHWTARITIGERFSAVSRGKHNAIGVAQRVMLMACGRNSQIIIGDDVGVSGSTISAMKEVVIGNRVLIGSGVLITDNDGHPEAPEGRRYGGNLQMKPVRIADDVFIGTRSIILKGVTIGAGSIIGAGSVVTRDVPPMVIAAGNPARVIRPVRTKAETERRAG